MNWIHTRRKPQLAVECPDRFRGTQRYVTAAECQRRPPNPPANLMPFGRYRNRSISSVPSNYLKWVLRTVDGRELLKAAIRTELARREA